MLVADSIVRSRVGNFIGSSYLVLFVLFYRRTYKKPTTGSASASQTKAKKVE
jgi:hypothetical protein